MDLDEPLNRAHQQQRKAERALRAGNFREAIRNFTSAGECFTIAEKNYFRERTSTLTLADADAYALEALISQRRFCVRQVELLTSKFAQLRRQWRELLEEKRQFCTLSNLDYERTMSDNTALLGEFDARDLRQKLFQKIDEQDSLLECLEEKKRGENSTTDKDNKVDVETPKITKSDQIVIEELRQCNDDLRRFIVVLLDELETKTKQIEHLRRELNSVRVSPQRRRSSSVLKKRDSAETTSAILPDLQPLEFPEFPPVVKLATRDTMEKGT